jgi:hypothetical protein
MEPSSSPFGTLPELREAGWSVDLEPGEERVYQLEFGVLAGGTEIERFQQGLDALGGPA